MKLKLVFIENKRPVTDSLTVAESFGKSHFHVLRDIEELECSEGFRESNFGLSSYRSSQNKELPKYLITQDGFSFLVMGYTGKEAARFKEMYIAEFNRMQQQLLFPSSDEIQNFLFNPDTIIKLAENWKEEKTLRLAAETKLEEVKPLITFAEACMTADRSLLIREVAKLISKNGVLTGERRLYNKLREWGMICKDKTEPTQRGMDMGLFEIAKGVKQTPKGARDWETTKVTPKGQSYIANRLQKEA